MSMNLKKRWAPILESIGITKDNKRFDDLCEYAEIQKNLLKSQATNESVNFANQYNTRGFGNVVAPGINPIPGQLGTAGSGDIAQTILPASVKIAAHTPGFNLLPVINVNSNRVDLLYYDWRYDDYTDGVDNVNERGTTFKLDVDAATIALLKHAMKDLGVKVLRGMLDKEVFVSIDGLGTPVTDWTTSPTGSKEGVVQFKGFSYIDGMPMFRIYTQDNSASTSGGQWGFNQALNTLPNDAQTIAEHFAGAVLKFSSMTDYINAPTDVTIPGTSETTPGAGDAVVDSPAFEVSLNEDVIDDFSANRSKDPMNRGEWDVTTAGKVGPETFFKTIQIGVRHISATLRLSELNDYQRMHGVNIVEKTKEQLVNQMQQEISIEIVAKVKEMAEKNRQQAIAASPTGESPFDMDISKYTGAGLYENSFSLTRKLWQKVKGAAYFIKSDGRWGNADYVVCSATMASALSEMKGYAMLPYNQYNMNLGRSIEANGTLDGLTIYIDPFMAPGDNDIYLGRVGGNEDPGLKMFAYMLAEQIEITSERTLAPHLYLYSRYTIGEYGFFPEKQYMAVHVHDNGEPADVIW